MPKYTYTAVDNSQKTITDTISASNLEHAQSIIHKKRYKLINIKELPLPPMEKLKIILSRFSLSNQEKLAIFSRQLAANLTSGIPLLRAFEIITENEADTRLKKVLESVTWDLFVGNKLSNALSKHPQYFARFYVAMIQTGEETGMLHKTLSILSDFCEKDLTFRKKLKAAMTYPFFLVGAATGLFLFLSFCFLPLFGNIYNNLGINLPWSTKLLLNISSALKQPIWLLIILFSFFLVFARLYFLSKTFWGRARLEKIMLGFPVLGKLISRVHLTRLSLTLSILTSSGVSFIRALEITGEVSEIELFRSAMNRVIPQIKQGILFSEALEDEAIFPHFFIQLIRMGEQTASLVRSLEKISEFYNREIIFTLDQILALIEPVIVIIMTVIMGFVIVSMFLPMYQVIQQF